MATWLSRSVARRVEPGVAKAFLLAVEVVIEGSVALERSSLGRRPPVDLDESLLCMAPLRDSDGGDAISSSKSGVWWKKLGMKPARLLMLPSIGLVVMWLGVSLFGTRGRGDKRIDIYMCLCADSRSVERQ